jgi:phosphate transport system permease protein
MTVLDQEKAVATTTVPPRPTAPTTQSPRRTRGARRTDWFAILGALAAGPATTGVLWTELGPFTGLLGYVVATWLFVVAYYALLVSFDENRIAMRDRVASFVMHSLALLLLVALVFIIVYTLVRGGRALLHLNFYTQDLHLAHAEDPLDRGGIMHAMVGTLIELSITLGIAVPLGLLAAVYLNEVQSRFSRFIRTIVDAMTALPDVIAGLFIYATMILIFHLGPSGIAAASALAVTILPIVIRAADVVLRLVPGSLKEASFALGATRWRTTWQVLLPTARPGLATAVILGAARAVGETSPVLLTAGATGYLNLNPVNGPMMSLPLQAYLAAVQSPEPNQIARGFGAAAVLLIIVVVLFVVARTIGGRAPGDLSNRQARRRAITSQRDAWRMARRYSSAAMPSPLPFATVQQQEENGP